VYAAAAWGYDTEDQDRADGVNRACSNVEREPDQWLPAKHAVGKSNRDQLDQEQLQRW
jgi:hypothetical protein